MKTRCSTASGAVSKQRQVKARLCAVTTILRYSGPGSKPIARKPGLLPITTAREGCSKRVDGLQPIDTVSEELAAVLAAIDQGQLRHAGPCGVPPSSRGAKV